MTLLEFIFMPQIIIAKFLYLHLIPELLQVSSITSGIRRRVFLGMQYLGYSIAAICGLVGAIRIYNLWQINGRHHIHIDSEIVKWVGASVFLVLAMTFVDRVF